MRMFDELLESENKKMIDIEYLSSGGYSDVYKIGDSVIKIGGPRKKYKIINHRRILQPLTRTNFLDLENNEPFACIEIAPAVETNLEDELTEEELYKIYKELRDDGIIWTDCKDINVGRLTRENVPKLNSEEIDIAPESIGADQKPKGEILKKGDYVIIDSDYIYKENDPDISFAGSKWSLSKKFEQKYQREKQSEIAKRYKKVKIISNENEKDNLNDVPNL